jgi:Tol biopolymer transport system component
MNGDRKNVTQWTAMFAVSPLRNNLAVVLLATACAAFWALMGFFQAPIAAQEKALQAGAKKSRIFLSALARAEGKEDEQYVKVILAVDPATGKCMKICECKDGLWPRVSPDGQTLVFTDQNRNELWNCGTGKDSSPGRINDDVGGRALWSPDGKKLLVSREKVTREKGTDKIRWEFETWRLNADGSKDAKLPLPKTHAVRDWSPDGKWLLTTSVFEPVEMPSRLSLMRPDGTGERFVPKERSKDVEAREARFSPDSLRLAYVLEKGEDISLWVSGVDGTDVRKVYEGAKSGTVGLCWSPDGKRLAVTLFDRVDGKTLVSVESMRFRLVVMDADGGNAKEVRLVGMKAIGVSCPEWRTN